MKLMKVVVILAVMLVCLTLKPASGANWIEYGTTPQGDVYSYNLSSVKNINGDIKQCWDRCDFANILHNVKSTTVLRQIDCRENRSRIISVIHYDSYGGVLRSNANHGSEWSDIASDTMLETLRKALCE